jgi:hypothetical protein
MTPSNTARTRVPEISQRRISATPAVILLALPGSSTRKPFRSLTSGR